VKALAAAVANDNPDAARYVHWGAISQDIDTALVLDLHAGIDLLLADLKRAIAAFAALADRRRRTPTVRWRPHSRSCLAAVAGSRAMSRF
jgi:3-carboxy-cis,cis-muconate cycloisomerase